MLNVTLHIPKKLSTNIKYTIFTLLLFYLFFIYLRIFRVHMICRYLYVVVVVAEIGFHYVCVRQGDRENTRSQQVAGGISDPVMCAHTCS